MEVTNHPPHSPSLIYYLRAYKDKDLDNARESEIKIERVLEIYFENDLAATFNIVMYVHSASVWTAASAPRGVP